MENVKKIQDLENKLWETANELRGNLSSEEYMHIVVTILFLKQLSLIYDKSISDIKNHYPDDWKKRINDIDYLNKFGCSFIVPEESHWDYISNFATNNKIGNVIDKALTSLEEKNNDLVGMFRKDFSRNSIDKIKLGRVVSIFSNINISNQEEDLLGRIYEYFLGKFFLERGQKSGAFYTPKSIVSLMVNIINPTRGKIYDPCCGSAGMFIQAKQHLAELNLKINDFRVYGQEYNEITWKLGKINLLLQGFKSSDINLGNRSADTFSDDLHKNEKFDFILANPPFNMKKWSEEAREKREWKYGIPPSNNANYAWLQHIIDKLNEEGKAAVVLAKGSLTHQKERTIRENMIKDNIISAIIDLPEKLFYTTGIPASIWIFDKNKKRQDFLFLDGTSFGKLIPGQKKTKEIISDGNNQITTIYHDFSNSEQIIDIPGLAKSVNIDEIEKNDYSLLPGSYITILQNIESKEEIKKELKNDLIEFEKLIKEANEMEDKLKEVIKKVFSE